MTSIEKEKIQYLTAIIAFLSGVILAVLSFFLNEHNIESGILMYIAQAFVYAGSIFGVTMYFRTKLGEFESRVKNKHKDEGDSNEHK